LPDAARDEVHQDVGIAHLGQSLLHIFAIHESFRLLHGKPNARTIVRKVLPPGDRRPRQGIVRRRRRTQTQEHKRKLKRKSQAIKSGVMDGLQGHAK
jgi:hypothetical protein